MSIITLNTRSLPDSAVTTAKIAADAVTDAKIADDVVGTEHLTANEVDTTALGADAVTAAQIADDAISEEHLDATVITGMTELAAEPADTDEFLISDAGTLKRIDYSHIKGGGITMVDQWRITSDHSGVADVTANWERNDNSEYGSIGTGMTESSGIFTFPSTGIYRVDANATLYITGGGSDYVQVQIKATTDNSSYSASSIGFGFADGANKYSNIAIITIIDVTDTSNVKVKLSLTQNSANTPKLAGATSLNRTYMTFTRLGDT